MAYTTFVIVVGFLMLITARKHLPTSNLLCLVLLMIGLSDTFGWCRYSTPLTSHSSSDPVVFSADGDSHSLPNNQ